MDTESQTIAQSLLSEANISQENIDQFFTLVDEFNSVPYKGIVEQGWKKAYIPFFSHNNENGFAHLEAQEQKNMINCRSAAFVLLKDHIIFNETNITNVLHCRYGKLTGNRNTHLMPYLTFIFAMTQKKH